MINESKNNVKATIIENEGSNHHKHSSLLFLLLIMKKVPLIGIVAKSLAYWRGRGKQECGPSLRLCSNWDETDHWKLKSVRHRRQGGHTERKEKKIRKTGEGRKKKSERRRKDKQTRKKTKNKEKS